MNEQASTYETISREDLIAENMNLREGYERLRFELDQLKKLAFGSRHERFIPTDPGQLALGMEMTEVPENPQIQTVEYQRQKPSTSTPPPSRMPLPADLPRQEIIIQPEGDISGLRKIGEEITEQLDYVPGKLFVRRFVRIKYAGAGGKGILIGSLPDRPIEKGIPGAGLLAHIIIDKYTDHLPVYRQAERFKREGVTIPTSTLTDWISQACKLLEPLGDTLRKLALASGYLQADETPIKVLDRDKKGSTHRGYYWVYHAPQEKLVFFDYQESRGREGPRQQLQSFKGYLQTDGYQVYEEFGNARDIHHLCCMAHARRMFSDAKDNDKARAEYVLGRIQELYAIERRLKGKSEDEIVTIRAAESLPILNGLKTWMVENYPAVLPQSLIGKAIAYSLQRWEKLTLYTHQGMLQLIPIRSRTQSGR